MTARKWPFVGLLVPLAFTFTFSFTLGAQQTPAAEPTPAPQPVAASPAGSPGVPFDIEFGYRFLDISGNRDMYRSQINEREGFLLRSFNFATTDFGGKTTLVDNFRLDMSDVGIGPASAIRLEAGRAEAYRLRLSYDRREQFSALPAFANPLLSSGVIPGQHTIDRVRTLFNAELELLPGRAITPIVGYERNRYEGPGQTTYTVGADEFRLRSDLSDTTQEFRVGVGFHTAAVSGQILQGWRRFRDNETLTLAPGAEGGNRSNPVLGIDPSLITFQRSDETTATTPVTTAFVTGRIGPAVRLIGSYYRAKASGDSSEQEDLTGSLVSFPLSRFFTGLSESTTSRSDLTQWKGSARVEVSIVPGLDATAGYVKQHRELEGYELINSLFLGTTTFVGGDPKDIQRLIEARTSLERTEETFEARLVARAVGPFSARAGWSRTNQDVTLTADPTEIVVPGSQEGTFDRRIDSFEAGVGFADKALGLTLGADARRDRADRPVVRTDFIVRDRVRLRAMWNLRDLVRIGATAMQVENFNRWPEVGYSGKMRQYVGDVEVTPVKDLRVRFNASRYEADSSVSIRRPQDFVLDTSIHSEDGRSFEGGVSWTRTPIAIDASAARFDNYGSFPFRIDRIRLRADLAVTPGASVIAEWSLDEYIESSFLYGDYRANRYGVGLRFHP